MTSPTNAVVDPALVRFARRVSHDLNNYSTVVRTYSELLLAELPADSPSRPDVEEIQRAAEGMVAYLQRVTRFARAGMMRKTPLPVEAIVGDAAAHFRTLTPDREVIVQTAGSAVIEADAQWLRDTIVELLQNADDAAPSDQPISVQVEASDTTVTIAVRDSGPGVQGVQETLCEPFSSSKQGVRGAGQGLAIAMACALALGGSLSIGREGDVTVAALCLPRSASAPSPRP